MSDSEIQLALFPAGLLEWAGHRSGGVRRLFYHATGRPAGDLIETPLLQRLRSWASAVARRDPGTPRIVLLIGGPGNGKTEAVEETIRTLQRELGLDTRLEDALGPLFSPTDGSTVPRCVRHTLVEFPDPTQPLVLTLVQDASVGDPARPGQSAARLLMEDLEHAILAGPEELYLACVNRGVLDDALIAARDSSHSHVRGLIEAVVQAAGVRPDAPACWPLAGFPDVASWPMDVESLLIARVLEEGRTVPSPAAAVLMLATDQSRWPAIGTCPAGDRCPFCRNRSLLANDVHATAFLQILRWYELASGKRWSFRDLLSLISYLLAGAPPEDSSDTIDPCGQARKLIDLDAQVVTRPSPVKLAAPFLLVAAQYQHALFGAWPRVGKRGIRPALKELGLDDNPTLLGMHYFLTFGAGASMPGTLRAHLASICEVLDPALADPDADVNVSSRTQVRLRELDSRFSHGVAEGLKFIRKFHNLSVVETDLLSRLANADDLLGEPAVRRRKPTTAAMLQMLLRDFSCRIVRRSIGTRAGVVRDTSTLNDFELVVSGDEQLLYQAGKRVEALLNDKERFIVILNTTFGEPAPPETRRVVLQTAKQRVRARQHSTSGRPQVDLRFLEVGSGNSAQTIPLTFELFRAVRELQDGMLAASLPRTVTAALDAARAKLAGRIVRDEEQLDGAEIRIGLRDDLIVREMRTFLVRQAGGHDA